MAVGEVVDDLADGPTVGAVGGVKLGVAEAGHGLAQVDGKLAEGFDLVGAGAFRGRAEAADGVAEFVQGAHGPNGITGRGQSAARKKGDRLLGAAGRLGLSRVVFGDGVRVMGVTVVATMVVSGPGKGRRYREEEQGSEENLLHAKNVAPGLLCKRGNPQGRIAELHQERKQRKERCAAARPGKRWNDSRRPGGTGELLIPEIAFSRSKYQAVFPMKMGYCQRSWRTERRGSQEEKE